MSDIPPEISAELRRRMDSQDGLLREIRDMVVGHIEVEKSRTQALEELVLLWRGSKVLLPIIAGITGAIGAVVSAGIWLKDHLR